MRKFSFFCSLVYFDVEGTNINDQQLKSILKNSFKTIETLRIKYCENLTKYIHSKICLSCENLKTFNVSKIEEHSLSKLKSRSLQSLKLYFSSFETNTLENLIPNLLNLKQLKFYDSNLNDNSLKLICFNFTNLKKLSISDHNVSDFGCKYISNLHPNLKELDISECDSITEEGKFCYYFFYFCLLNFFFLIFFF